MSQPRQTLFPSIHPAAMQQPGRMPPNVRHSTDRGPRAKTRARYKDNDLCEWIAFPSITHARTHTRAQEPTRTHARTSDDCIEAECLPTKYCSFMSLTRAAGYRKSSRACGRRPINERTNSIRSTAHEQTHDAHAHDIHATFLQHGVFMAICSGILHLLELSLIHI